MRHKFQKRSALKFDGRIIPEAKPSGINLGLIPRPLGRKCLKDTPLLAAGLFIIYGVSFCSCRCLRSRERFNTIISSRLFCSTLPDKLFG